MASEEAQRKLLHITASITCTHYARTSQTSGSGEDLVPSVMVSNSGGALLRQRLSLPTPISFRTNNGLLSRWQELEVNTAFHLVSFHCIALTLMNRLHLKSSLPFVVFWANHAGAVSAHQLAVRWTRSTKALLKT
jgi:hypothetical protein